MGSFCFSVQLFKWCINNKIAGKELPNNGGPMPVNILDVSTPAEPLSFRLVQLFFLLEKGRALLRLQKPCRQNVSRRVRLRDGEFPPPVFNSVFLSFVVSFSLLCRSPARSTTASPRCPATPPPTSFPPTSFPGSPTCAGTTRVCRGSLFVVSKAA